MRSTSPRLADPASPRRAAARGCVHWLAAAVVLLGCYGNQPPAPPGQPIAAPAEVTLGTMDVECEALLSALGLYKQCPNLDDEDRAEIDAWHERAQQDFAAGKKANPEANAQHAIAAACRKAVASVSAANQRCHAGPKPVQQ
jgi:hypothetical protein